MNQMRRASAPASVASPARSSVFTGVELGSGAAIATLLLVVTTAPVRGTTAQDLPRGTIIDAVTSLDDASENYALYLPSDYSPDRPWSVLMAFHPGARGRAIVETYQAAAEKYGYIVAGSNTSRNGPWEISRRAVRAMSRDLGRRFTIDAARVYLTGHSGGARVAMETAQGPGDIAGVIASSAGFGDARPRKRARFAIFATVGIDDFNYREMRVLDATLTTPHALAVFDGGHTLPPATVAMTAIEWLELQAMRAGRRVKDQALVDAWYRERQRALAAAPDDVARFRLAQQVVADFEGLQDVGADRQLGERLGADRAVKRALAAEKALLDLEARQLHEALEVEGRLGNPETRAMGLARLRSVLAEWSATATQTEPSPERSRARRLLGALAGGGQRVQDDDYRALLQKYRWRD